MWVSTFKTSKSSRCLREWWTNEPSKAAVEELSVAEWLKPVICCAKLNL